MKYEKCLTCAQLGQACDGPNFLAMDTAEMGEWCNAKRKQLPGMTYDKVAAETKLSKTAVYDFFNGRHSDCRLETIRPIIRLVTGGKWDDNPCGNLTNTEKAQYDEAIRRYEAELKWRDDKIQSLLKQNERLEQQIDEKDTTIKDRGHFMRRKDKAISCLAFALALSLLVIFGAIALDFTTPGAGFIWP